MHADLYGDLSRLLTKHDHDLVNDANDQLLVLIQKFCMRLLLGHSSSFAQQ